MIIDLYKYEKQRISAFFVPINKNSNKNIDKCYIVLYTV